MSTNIVLLGLLASIITGVGLMSTISRTMESDNSERTRHRKFALCKNSHKATLITIAIMILLGLVFIGTVSLYLIYSNDNSSIKYFNAIFYGLVLTSSIYYISEVALIFLHSLFKSIKTKILNNK